MVQWRCFLYIFLQNWNLHDLWDLAMVPFITDSVVCVFARQYSYRTFINFFVLLCTCVYAFIGKFHVIIFWHNCQFLVNVNSWVHIRYMLSPSVCNIRAPDSAGWNFPQFFFTIRYLGHPLTSTKILRRSSQGNPSVRGFKRKRGSLT